MATALCGLQSSATNGKQARARREHRRKVKDSRRRQAAILFLSNISLDGRPQCQPTAEDAEQKPVEETGGLKNGDGGAAVGLPRAESEGLVSKVTDFPAEPGSGSSSSFPDVLSPVRPALVTSPGAVAAGSVGPNEVFLESSGAVDAQFPGTPLPPVTAVHQPCSRAKSTPAVLSPTPAGNSLDSRQRQRNISGSPGPKVPKKVHFIKSMRQYDTRGSRYI